MNKLPNSLLLDILSRLDDSTDVARCRVASKVFDSVFPGLRSINLRCTEEWYDRVFDSSSSRPVKPFKTVFLHLISKLQSVESICISLDGTRTYFFYLMADDFAEEWVPRVSGSLKSLSISDHHSSTPSNFLSLISQYCHNLVNLKLKSAWLSMRNTNPMPMLTSLTLEYIRLEDENLYKLNRCFPNLQELNLVNVKGLRDPRIHLLNLQTCHLAIHSRSSSLTIITPNLITLILDSFLPTAIHVEAPMLSHFHLDTKGINFPGLEKLWLDSSYIGSLFLEFQITRTVESLIFDSGRDAARDNRDSKLTLRKVFKVFPNVSSLCINSGAWSQLEACLNPESWELLNGRKGLKQIRAYLVLVDPVLTFSCVAYVLDQCIGLFEVSLLIHDDVDDTVSKGFMSKCMARWPRLKWRWGIWSKNKEDSWMVV